MSAPSIDSAAEQTDIVMVEEDACGIAGAVRVVLNRPAALNALSEAMLASLQQTLDRIAASSARVVILAGAGRAFCAGHDLAEMRAHPDLDAYRDLFARCSRMMLTIVQMPQPVIAQVHGIATAAGCQLVAMCDLAVAAQDARFAVSGVNLGLFCATPSVPLARNVPRKQALEMLLTGDFISAAEAAERGLINRAVPAEQLEREVATLAEKICRKPRAAISAGKGLFYRQMEMGLDAAYQLAGQTMACNMMEDATLEGTQAFLEKRPPRW